MVRRNKLLSDRCRLAYKPNSLAFARGKVQSKPVVQRCTACELAVACLTPYVLQGMPALSNWSATPVEVLRRALELQDYALDNCGAACTCSAWREVVNISSIVSLHLYADSDSPDDTWTAFLNSRRSITCLTLIQSATWDFSTDSLSQTLIQAPRNSMLGLNTACKELHLSEHLARHIGTGFTAPPQLQKFSLEWNGQWAMHPNMIDGQQTFQVYDSTFPVLTGITSLTELTIDMRNDTYGKHFYELMPRLPTSIQRLILRGFGSSIKCKIVPAHGTQLAAHMLLTSLTALTHLSLTKSLVSIVSDGITCLSSLQSLDLSSSQVCVDEQLELSQLTRLTCLDFTFTVCFCGDIRLEPLDIFQAWPNLKVPKCGDAVPDSYYSTQCC